MIAFRGGALKASGFRNGLGSGFRGLINYLQKGRAPELSEVPEIAGEKVEMAAEPSDLPQGGRVAWSSTRNLPTDDIDRAPYWMRAWANQNPRVEKPVYHFGVAVAPDEKLGPDQWERIADGRAWRPSFDALKQQKVLRQLEQELGLRAVPTYGDQRRELEHELGLPARELEKPFAFKVRDIALEDFRQSHSFEGLKERLAQHGLRSSHPPMRRVRCPVFLHSHRLAVTTASHLSSCTTASLRPRGGFRDRSPRPHPGEASARRCSPATSPRSSLATAATVMLIDADHQGTASVWCELRRNPACQRCRWFVSSRRRVWRHLPSRHSLPRVVNRTQLKDLYALLVHQLYPPMLVAVLWRWLLEQGRPVCERLVDRAFEDNDPEAAARLLDILSVADSLAVTATLLDEPFARDGKVHWPPGSRRDWCQAWAVRMTAFVKLLEGSPC